MSEMPQDELALFLQRYGYVSAMPRGAPRAPGELVRALAEYQEFNGLTPTGVVDEATETLMSQPRCGLPDKFSMPRAGRCKWPDVNVKYATSISLPQLSEADVVRAFNQAAQQWNAVCGIRMVRTNQGNAAQIWARSGTGQANNLDGRGGTLAWSELPCQNSMQQRVNQMYDQAENWSYNMAVAVMCHELGHALGLEHLQAGSLLAPYYNASILKPQAGDIQAIQGLYPGLGQPNPPTTPPTNPPTPPTGGTIDVSGLIYINGQPYQLVPRV